MGVLLCGPIWLQTNNPPASDSWVQEFQTRNAGFKGEKTGAGMAQVFLEETHYKDGKVKAPSSSTTFTSNFRKQSSQEVEEHI